MSACRTLGAVVFILLTPLRTLAWSPFAFREELREGGPWLRDALFAAIIGFVCGYPVLFITFFVLGFRYRNQANVLTLSLTAAWQNIGTFVAAFVIGCFAFCLVIMLPGFLLYCLWYTYQGLPIGDENIFVLHWLYVVVFVISFATAVVVTIKRTNLRSYLH